MNQKEQPETLLQWVDGELDELRLWNSSFMPNGSEQAKAQILSYEAFRAKILEHSPQDQAKPAKGETDCKCEERHGETTVWCCNHCGKSIDPSWRVQDGWISVDKKEADS